MNPESVAKTFEIIFSQGVDFSMDDTYESIEILSGQTKPSYTEFEKVHEEVTRSIIPFEDLRRRRNGFLTSTDWTQTNDIGLENEEEWAEFRQRLRDLPTDTEDPNNPVWPEQPQVKIVQGKNIRTELSDIKTELKADLSETKTNLSETKTNLSKTKTELKADLQTTRTELVEERTLHETTRTQLRNTQTELDVAKIKLLNIEARMQIIESNISKVVV